VQIFVTVQCAQTVLKLKIWVDKIRRSRKENTCWSWCSRNKQSFKTLHSMCSWIPNRQFLDSDFETICFTTRTFTDHYKPPLSEFT